MNIAVTSENMLKVYSVKQAYEFLKDAVVTGYKADSGVGEQPVGDDTLRGARNRIVDVCSRHPDLDRIISIENGIFREGGQWHDKAVVLLFRPYEGTEHVAYSDSVVFPDRFVERAREIGFDRITVGKVMADAGHVEDPKDPHLYISGKSRRQYLEETVRGLVMSVEHL
ncbi:TPA: DUF84 family protein [Candidatus Woesearchaeota archaeon]|nr:DUF84 family protein [Candidatus Woesearchaeota archaeon]